MRKTETVELTVLCLIEDDDKLLLQNRVKKDWQGYALPGGHVEPRESFGDAVICEMKEETGLTILDPRLVGVKQFPFCPGAFFIFRESEEKMITIYLASVIVQQAVK